MTYTESLQCAVPNAWVTSFSQCLFEWQSLEGGGLALLAAALSIWFLRRQINQSDRHENERLQRQHNAARATLPLTLSGLIDPLREMLVALHAAKSEVEQHGISTSFMPPSTPSNFVSELQSVIASTNNRTVIEPISQIIREIQTLWARVRVLNDERGQRRQAGLSRNVDEWIVQAAQIHALVESLFDYARGERDNGPTEVSWGRVESPIFQLGIESATLAELTRAGLAKSSNFWTIDDR